MAFLYFAVLGHKSATVATLWNHSRKLSECIVIVVKDMAPSDCLAWAIAFRGRL